MRLKWSRAAVPDIVRPTKPQPAPFSPRLTTTYPPLTSYRRSGPQLGRHRRAAQRHRGRVRRPRRPTARVWLRRGRGRHTPPADPRAAHRCVAAVRGGDRFVRSAHRHPDADGHVPEPHRPERLQPVVTCAPHCFCACFGGFVFMWVLSSTYAHVYLDAFHTQSQLLFV